MIQYILCPACAEGLHNNPKDIADGWHMHKVPIKAKRPANHQITINAGPETTIIPVPVLTCDLNNEEIPDGSDAVAATMWRPSRGEELVEWWHEFSQPNQ